MSNVGTVVYGAFELKKNYQKNLGEGFAFAALLHLAIVGGFFLQNLIFQERGTSVVRIIKSLAELGPPPRLTELEIPQIQITVPEVAPPAVGVPKPVPEDEVIEEVKFPTQEELKEAPLSDIVGDAVIDIPEDQLPGRGVFEVYEVLPQPISKVQAKYPDLAKRAGIEGKVVVDFYVDKNGKVFEPQIYAPSGSNVGFEEAALKAIVQWTFSPGIQNGRPVAVWMTQTFKFEIK